MSRSHVVAASLMQPSRHKTAPFSNPVGGWSFTKALGGRYTVGE
jgi:hypothetical protein